MRRTLRSWLAGVQGLCLLLCTQALAAETLASANNGTQTLPGVQVIGWSADEQRYAVRVYAFTDSEWSSDLFPREELEKLERDNQYNASRKDKDGFCKGYVDHHGKRFRGALELKVFEGGRQLVSLPIQDQPRCTDGKVAAARLTEAKKRLAELGIDMGRPGTEHTLAPDKRMSVTPQKQPPFVLVYVANIEDLAGEDDTGVVKSKGVLELYRRRDGKGEKLVSRQVSKDYRQDMGAVDAEALTSVHLSPSGERMVVLASRVEGGLRGGYTCSVWIEKLLGWPEGAIAQEK